MLRVVKNAFGASFEDSTMAFLADNFEIADDRRDVYHPHNYVICTLLVLLHLTDHYRSSVNKTQLIKK
jgi:hypothetical protein